MQTNNEQERRGPGRRLTDMTPQERNNMEKHFIAIMVTIVLSVLGWVAFKVTQLAEVSSAMTVEVRNVKENLNRVNDDLGGDISEIKKELKVAVSDRFTATDAREMRDGCQQRMSVLEERLTRLESLEDVRHNGKP